MLMPIPIASKQVNRCSGDMGGELLERSQYIYFLFLTSLEIVQCNRGDKDMAGKGKSIILQIHVGLFIVQHVVCMYGTWKKKVTIYGHMYTHRSTRLYS